VVTVVAVTRHAGDATATERALYDLVRSIPSSVDPLWRGLYGAGALWAVGLVFAAAIVARRLRLALGLLSAAILARTAGWSLRHAVGASARGLLHTTGAATGFPAIRVALVVAVAATAAPFVTRPTRHLGRALAVAVALSALALGHADPDGVLAAILLGWGIAAALHLAFGSPGGRPAPSRVASALRDLGVEAHDVRLAELQTPGMTVMRGCDAAGPLRIKVFGRDEADAQLLAKVWRALVYKESGPGLFLRRREQVEHEAYVMLLARSHGIRVPEVVVAGEAGPGAAVLVQRQIEGSLLRDADAKTANDDLLAEIWQQVKALHAARVVHGRLDAEHVALTLAGPALVGFTTARTTNQQRLAAQDVAQLMAATSAITGPERAVAAAVRTLGAEAVRPSLPLIQLAALTRSTRLLLDGRRQARTRLANLREVAAEALGTTPPELRQLRRVKPSSILLAVGTLIAAGGLLAGVGSGRAIWQALTGAEWQWLTLAVVLSLASNLGYAVALQGTVLERLPLWPTTELQVAMSFSNLAVPAVGGIAMQVRFLQRQGVDLASAVAAGGLLSSVANVVVAAAVMAVALAAQPTRFSLSLVPTSGLAVMGLCLIGLAGVAAAIVAGIPRLRRAVLPPVRQAWSTIWGALRAPRLVALLVGGNVVVALMVGGCLAASLAAFGESVPFGPILAVSVAVQQISQLVPISGGGTAVSAVGLSGALVALGVARPVAAAAALVDQVAITYLPALPGWFATRHLLRNDYL
jgi:undecaprenyl-diphosphatase